MKPLVSIVIPHYNRVVRLIETLASVKHQSFTDWEVIVVDDCSPTDPTEAILAAFPQARVFLQAVNLGPSAARNRGVAEARGRFVAFLDSDDRWEPDKLAAQVSAVLARPNPDRVICATRTRAVEDGGYERLLPKRAVRPSEPFDEFLYLGHGFAQSSSLLLSREAAIEIKFDERLRQFEDHLFFVAAGNAGLEYVLVPEALVTWYNDSRSDRLTREDDLRKGATFLEVGRTVLGRRAALAFEARFLGPALFRARPMKAMGVFARALAARAVNPRDAILLAMKIILRGDTYRRLRARMVRIG